MAKVCLSTLRILFLFTLCEAAVSANSFAGWDSDCVKKQLESSPENCDKNNPHSIANVFQKSIISDPAVQDRQTSEFFYDFIKDQNKQTSCESNMLNQLDLLPSTKFGTGTNSDRRPIENRSSYLEQKTILSTVFRALPALAALEKPCEDAQKRFGRAKNMVLVSDAARGSSTYAQGDPDRDYRNSLEYTDSKSTMGLTCGAYEKSVAALWSGSSSDMNVYIKNWVERYQKGGARDENAFFQEALPIDDEKHSIIC